MVGEYSNWLAQLNKLQPVSELSVGVWPEYPDPNTPEYKAFLKDVKRSAVGPNRRAMAEWF